MIPMAMAETQAIPVREMSQAGQVRRAAAALAERMGFDSEETGRVSLVATEAATNLVKHAQGGEIVLSSIPAQEIRSVDILSLDRGPGIPDLDRAVRDGYSTSGGLGGGLAAIRRLASRFDLYTAASGTILFARVAGRPGASEEGPDHGSIAPGSTPVEVGAVQIPYPGEYFSGDSWAVAYPPGRAMVLVVDGLGHGAEAHAAASLATRIFGEHSGRSPGAILDRLHDALHPTRGAAAAVLELDLEERTARFAGIGNNSGSIHSKGEQRSMVSHHGVLGHQVRKVHEFVYPWPAGSLVVLHTDGIATHWALSRYPGLERRGPAVIAALLYRDFTRGRDDATAVVLREAA